MSASNPSSVADDILHEKTSPSAITKPSPPSASLSAYSLSGSGAGSLNPRSCVTCRRRKVKCDKRHPCNHCTRQGIECVYPAPGRAPRKPRKSHDAELVERLRRLENVVQSLGAQVTSDDAASPQSGAEGGSVNGQSQDRADREKIRKEVIEDMTPEEKIEEFKQARKEFKKLMAEKWEKEKEHGDIEQLSQRFGTLLVSKGRSRYIQPGLWSTLNAEMEELKESIFDDSEEEEDEEPWGVRKQTSSDGPHQGFMFGLSSITVDMSLLRPPQPLLLLFWETYKRNIDPLFKVLHTPMGDKFITASCRHMASVPYEMDCKIMAISYAAVTSTFPEECRSKFGETKQNLLARYRFATEQALARAEFLQTDSIFVLQAFVIYLLCLRRNTNARAVWSLSALAIRIAQRLGLHRDGSHYANLPIYKQEMRRRIWWNLSQLDYRAREELGSELASFDFTVDTRLPMNINDADLTFEMTEPPEERQGFTDMTLCLSRMETNVAICKILDRHPKCNGPGRNWSKEQVEKRKKVVAELEQLFKTKYLPYCDVNNPKHHMLFVLAALIPKKLKVMIYQPFQRKDGGASLPQEVKDEIFMAALESVECDNELHRDARSPKLVNFSWLLQSYTQWHAIAFLVSELRTRTTGPLVDRAWSAVDFATTKCWEDGTPVDRLDAHLWRPLKLLMAKAKEARRLALGRADTKNLPAMHVYTDTMDLRSERNHDAIDAFEGAGDPTNDPMGLWVPPPPLDIGVAADSGAAANVPLSAMNPFTGFPPVSAAGFANLPTPMHSNASESPLTGQRGGGMATTGGNGNGNDPNGIDMSEFDFSATDWLNTTTTTTTTGMVGNATGQLVGDGGGAQPMEDTTGMDPEGTVNWATWDDMVNTWQAGQNGGGLGGMQSAGVAGDVADMGWY